MVARRWVYPALGVALALGTLLAGLAPVARDATAVLVWRGQPLRTVAPWLGFVWHVPVLESVRVLDRRQQVIALDGAPVAGAGGDAMVADGMAIWRIDDPLRFAASLGDADGAAAPLRHALAAQIAAAAATVDPAVLAGGARDGALRSALDHDLARYGVGVRLVAVRRLAPGDGAPADAAVARAGARIAVETEAVAAAAHRDAALIRADAEARAAAIYAASFGRDPAFYDFYRAMQSYTGVLAQKGSNATIVISPDSAYLKQFRGK